MTSEKFPLDLSVWHLDILWSNHGTYGNGPFEINSYMIEVDPDTNNQDRRVPTSDSKEIKSLIRGLYVRNEYFEDGVYRIFAYDDYAASAAPRAVIQVHPLLHKIPDYMMAYNPKPIEIGQDGNRKLSVQLWEFSSRYAKLTIEDPSLPRIFEMNPDMESVLIILSTSEAMRLRDVLTDIIQGNDLTPAYENNFWRDPLNNIVTERVMAAGN